jgi:probable rRNA maturation factor
MVEVEFKKIHKSKKQEEVVKQAILACFEVEDLNEKNVTINVFLTNPETIHKINLEYRNVDKPTDVLSFPMFEKDEVDEIRKKGSKIPEVLGDIIISIEQVKAQAEEYGHSFERELSYMAVHGFYHIIGYDHIKEEDKKIMRSKEEAVLRVIGQERE